MESTSNKIFEKNVSTIGYEDRIESVFDYTLNVPGEDEITFKFKTFEFKDGSKGFEFFTENIQTLNELTESNDPVEFRKGHSGIELEEIIEFKDELVENVVDIVNKEVKEIMDEAGVKSEDRGYSKDSTLTADVLSGKINQYQFETYDNSDVPIGEKVWREYKEVDGKAVETLIQGGKENKPVEIERD